VREEARWNGGVVTRRQPRRDGGAAYGAAVTAAVCAFAARRFVTMAGRKRDGAARFEQASAIRRGVMEAAAVQTREPARASRGGHGEPGGGGG